MTPPPASAQVDALEARLASLESEVREVHQTLTRIESAILGLDGKGGVLGRIDRMDADVLLLLADYHGRRGIQQFVAPFWAILGGVAVVISEHLLGRFF
jgi:hypothetical protein